MTALLDRYAQNGAVRIHYMDRRAPWAPGLPLLVSPGIWEPAERALPLFETMTRRTVAVSYRGRGRSDTPATGYDLEDHVSDLAAVVASAQLTRFCLLAFSRGVGPAIAYTLGHPPQVAGLVIVDHPPIHWAWAPGTAATWKGRTYLGFPFTDFMRPEAFDGIEREARQVEFWDELPRITCPVSILRGLDADTVIPSEITDDDSRRYQSLIPHCRQVGFDASGHMIPDEEPGKYARVVGDFLAQLDLHVMASERGSDERAGCAGDLGST